MNWLLLFVPVAVALEHLAPQQSLWIFAAAALAIVPLAGWLGRATEQIAERTGEGIGGRRNLEHPPCCPVPRLWPDPDPIL